MNKPAKLLDQRNRALHAARDVVDDFTAAGRDSTADERQTIRKAIAEFDALNIALDAAREEQRDNIPDGAPLAIADQPAEVGQRAANDIVRRWAMGEGSRVLEFRSKGLDREMESRVLTTSETSNDAGHTIMESWATQIYDYREKVSGFRSTMPNIITTMSGEQLNIPRNVNFGAAALVAEGASVGGTDPTYSTVTLNAYKYAQLITLTSELVMDTGYDLMGHLTRSMGRALAKATDNHYINGTGSNQPQGILTTGGVDTGVTGTSQTSITMNNLIDLKYSIDEEYLMDSCWLMNHQTAGQIAQLTDSDGQYFWAPSRIVGEPDMLLGAPVKTSPHMPAIARNKKVVAFGSFMTACCVRDVGNIMLARSDEFDFDNDRIAFRATMRTDSAIIYDNAVKVLATSNS